MFLSKFKKQRNLQHHRKTEIVEIATLITFIYHYKIYLFFLLGNSSIKQLKSPNITLNSLPNLPE